MKVLDSTFIIDLLRGDKATLEIMNNGETLLTTQINLFEVIRGLFLKNVSPEKFHNVVEALGDIKVLQLDDNAVIKSSEIFAELVKHGSVISDCDCMTAGITLSKGINKIVTRNVEHFKRIKGIIVEAY